LLAKYGKQYIAFPLAIGSFDLSSPALKSPLRRFNGLLLMRLRLRASNDATQEHRNISFTSENFFDRYLTSIKRVGRSIKRVLRPIEPELRPTIRVVRRIKGVVHPIKWIVRSVKWLVSSIVWMERQIKWVVSRNEHLFQFVLIDSTMEELMQQIDKTDRRWLSRTYAK